MPSGMRKPGSHDGAPGAELGIAKQDLDTHVQSRVDNLQSQVARVLERYGVSNFEELQALGEESSDNVSKEDIDRLLELAGNIQKLIEGGKIDYETEVPIGKGIRVSDAAVIGDRIVYRTKSKPWSHGARILTEEGKTLELPPGYSNLQGPIDVGGQIAFTAYRAIGESGKEQVVVMEDGTIIGECEEYTSIDGIREIGGRIVFRVLKN